MDKLTEWIKGERGRLMMLARECKITHGAILQWDRIPSERVVAVENVTGIPREQLRPDLYREVAQ